MMAYPTCVEYDDIKYDINTDFRVALKCMKLIANEEVSDIERTIGVVTMLFGENIPINEETLMLSQKFLQCGEINNTKGTVEKDMDFEQDQGLIEASFLSDYGMDLSEVKGMHWWKFCNLIGGLKPDCALNRVREIRNYDLSTIKGDKTRMKIIKAKEQVMIKSEPSLEDREVLDEFEQLFK